MNSDIMPESIMLLLYKQIYKVKISSHAKIWTHLNGKSIQMLATKICKGNL